MWLLLVQGDSTKENAIPIWSRDWERSYDIEPIRRFEKPEAKNDELAETRVSSNY